ncbi:hypothetical protein GOP47_0030060 [Adiantum capillus-veneris]|nr:hypothetical protein GOP47_0030060 [Adiantum capillus-veneris]
MQAALLQALPTKNGYSSCSTSWADPSYHVRLHHEKRRIVPLLAHSPISARGQGRFLVSCSSTAISSRVRFLVSCSSTAISSRVEDVVIVGGGIAGIATALALHRLGIKSRVLEQSPTLRVTGAALGIWTNGWRALEALGVADDLREKFVQILGFQFYSTDDKCLADFKFSSSNKHVELRGVDRRVLLETLTNALPTGTILYDSHVINVQRNKGSYSRVELKGGSTLQAKVIVGCDGIGSVVAKELGHKEAHYAGYIGIRGVATFSEQHTFPRAVKQVLGRGVRMGCLPQDSNRVYWFIVFNSPSDKKIVDPDLVKEEALRLVRGWPEAAVDVVRKSPVETLSRAAIADRWMWPWSLSKLHESGVTIAGDAMHPVTPNLAQGGCTALEDGVVLARVVSKLFKETEGQNLSMDEEMKRIELALDGYTKQRQQRLFGVAVQANLIGKVMQADSELFCSMRDALLPRVLSVDAFVEHTLYDVGALA